MSELAIAPDLQMRIPGMDGYRADKIAVAFAGAVDLDRMSEDDLAFVESLTLGSQVELRVSAIVTKKGFTLSPGGESAADTTGYGVGLKVHSLEVA